MSEHKIVRMRPDQFESVCEAAQLAFMQDPMMEFLAPDLDKRKRVSAWFWRAGLGYGQKFGVVETDETGKSAAIWLPPGQTDMPLRRLVRTRMIQFPFRLGLRGTLRFMSMMGTTDKAHKRAAPGDHWYLLTLATHPDLQGKGVGSALLNAGHRRADESGLPCYLETGTEYDIAFYSKRGYEIAEPLTVGTLNGAAMVRQPQPVEQEGDG